MIRLNEVQRKALSDYFNPDISLGGEPFDENQEFEIHATLVDDGTTTLQVNGAFLHTDGEWATFPETAGPGMQEQEDVTNNTNT